MALAVTAARCRPEALTSRFRVTPSCDDGLMASKTALLTAVVVLAMTLLFDYLDLLPLRRGSKRRVEGVLLLVIFGTMYLSPSSFTSALDWISREKSKQIVEMIDDIIPTPSTTIAPPPTTSTP